MRLKSTTFYRLLFSILAMMILSCNGLEVLATAPSGRTLVVYYSFTGNVRSIVNTLDEKINADVVEILPAEDFCNMAVTLCHITDRMFQNYLKHLEKTFVEKGGIRERMHAARTNYRQQQDQRLKDLEAENQWLKEELRKKESNPKS